MPKDIDNAKLLSLLEQGEKIRAIRLVMTETGRSLHEAKDYVEGLPLHKYGEALKRGDPIGNIDDTEKPCAGRIQKDLILSLLEQGNKVKAIQLVIKQSGLSLHEAKNYVDTLSLQIQATCMPGVEENSHLQNTLLRFQGPLDGTAPSKRQAAANRWGGRVALILLIVVLASIVLPLLAMGVVKLLAVAGLK